MLAFAHAHAHARTHTHTHTQHTRMHARTQHTHTHACTHTQHACMHAHNTHTYACMHTYAQMHAHAQTHAHTQTVYLHPPVPMMHATSDQEITITGLIEGNSSQNTSPHWLIQVAHRTYTPLALHQEFANEGVTASESPLTLSSSRKQAMLMLGGLLPEWRYVAVMLWASSGCHCETGHTTRVTIIEISPASTEEPQIPSNPETPRKPSGM